MTDRYLRQITLPEWGSEGQACLARAKVLVVGAGGLGSAILTYLASGGVGTLGVIDPDEVQTSNLPRQNLFSESQIGQPKASAVKDRLRALRSDLVLQTWTESLQAQNAEQIISQFDLVVDGSDNFQTKFLLSDVCVKLCKPLVIGSANQWEAHLAVFYPPKGPCYRCYQRQFPRVEVPTCERAGVLGPVVGVVGAWQALEAMKTLVHLQAPQKFPQGFGDILFFDFLGFRTFRSSVQPWSACKACGAQAEPLVFDKGSEINAADLKQLKDSWTVLDFCETPSQHFNEKRIILRFADLAQRKIPQNLSVSENYVLLCEQGLKSREAFLILQELGFQNMKSLRGGLAAWVQDLK